MLTPYRIFDFKHLLRDIYVDDSGYINEKLFFMYDDINIVKTIYDFLYLNVLFITPRFKITLGYEYMNVKTYLENKFGSDIIIYYCTDAEMNSIIQKSLKSMDFDSVSLDITKIKSLPTKIVKNIDDLYDPELVINTIIYFIKKYTNLDNYSPIISIEKNITSIQTNDANKINNKNILKNYILKFIYDNNFSTDYIDDVMSDIYSSYGYYPFPDYYIINDDNVEIYFPEGKLTLYQYNYSLT